VRDIAWPHIADDQALSIRSSARKDCLLPIGIAGRRQTAHLAARAFFLQRECRSGLSTNRTCQQGLVSSLRITPATLTA
jgi:hypothetical protein